MSPDADTAAPDARGGGGTTTTTAGPSACPAAAGGLRVIEWEDVVPRLSLRVVLVEHDDSTRQVVTALLRKCGYNVVALADGMKAWEVMRDGIFCFDLVLTEVAMPTVSGISLLSRIVAAEKCRNIPVIMMSSQDSIGLVLNCMQNGAVDFLVKPVRKNELRNLWQHVWRRQNMNSRTNASENNAASNHVSANAGDGLNTGESGNEESDAQQEGDEIQCVENLEVTVREEGAGLSREFGENQNGTKHSDVIMVPTPPDAPNGNTSDINSVQEHSAEKNANSKCHHGTFAKFSGQLMDTALGNSDASSHHPSDPGNDLLALKQLTSDRKCKYSVLENNASLEILLHEDSKGATIGRTDSCPSHFLEINPGEEQLNGYTNQKFRKKDIFNHSNSSAFSRYGDKRIRLSAQQPFSCSLCIAHYESVYDEGNALQPNEVLPSHQHTTDRSTMRVQVPLDSSSVREDAGTSNSSPRKDCSSCPPFGFTPAPIPVGSVLPYQKNFGAGYGAIMQPIYHLQTPFMHCYSAATENVAIQPAPCLSNYDENLSKPTQFHEHKQSASCSQDIHKGSWYTCSGETDAYTSMVVALQSGNESGVQNCSDRGLDSDQSHPEAALKKFLKKRKDRCFEKKVRYQSRKMITEQRPRVKGQFASHKPKSCTTDAETD